MGGCQNYGPFSGTLNNRCRIVIGTIILTITRIDKIKSCSDPILVFVTLFKSSKGPRDGKTCNGTATRLRLTSRAP